MSLNVKQFYIKLDSKEKFAIEVSPFDEMDFCSLFEFGTKIKINLASIQLFGTNSSGNFDRNINQEILSNFNQVEHLYTFFNLPLDYSIFELDLDIVSNGLCNVLILDECETTFKITRGNKVFLKKICNYFSENMSDIVLSLVNSNLGKYVCFRILNGNIIEYKIIDNELDVKLFFK